MNGWWTAPAREVEGWVRRSSCSSWTTRRKFLEAIARRLEMRGLDVTTASDGAAALEAARRSHFDLALLDLKMPGMKGEEVLATLKAEHSSSR